MTTAGQTVRSLLRAPVYSLTVIAILALAIGANTAVFSVTHAVLLRSLPYEHPERVVEVSPAPLASGGANGWGHVAPDFASLVTSAAIYVDGGTANLSRHGSAQRVSLAQVTPDFFRVLGVRPLLGRDLSSPPDDGRAVVLGHRLWTQTFAADPSVVGRDIDLNGRGYTVVGVMPADVAFPAGTDLWLPFPPEPGFYGGAFAASAIARLRSVGDLVAVTKKLQDRVDKQYADLPAGLQRPPARLTPLREELSGPVRTPLLMLLGIAGLVTLLGCLNLAGLVLARSTARTDEISIRRALGAGRGRLFGQLLGEVMILAVVAGAVSLLAATWTTRLVIAVLPGGVQGLRQASVTAPVLLFAGALTLAAGFVVGVLPALYGALDGHARAGTTRTTTEGPGRSRTQSALIVAQVALAFVLVTGASLFGRSLALLRAVPLGYDLSSVLTFSVRLPHDAYPDRDTWEAYAHRLLEGIRGLPGVTSAGATTYLPLTGKIATGFMVRPEGSPEDDRTIALSAKVTRDYLRAMGIPVLEGHPFAEATARTGALDHVVINRSLARKLFGDGPAVGRTLLIRTNKWQEAHVDAVIGDVRFRGPTATASNLVLTNLEASPSPILGLAVRATGDPAALGQRVRDVVKSLDPSVAPYGVRTTGEAASREIAARRALALLSALFGVAALGVCALGLHGLVAQGVARRRRELGVRLALGARVPSLVGRTALAPLKLVLAGLLLGLPVTWALSSVVKGLLFQVAPRDPVVIISVIVGVAGLAVVAAWIPARRITRVAPAEALRSE